jgi:hypothetical protein
MEEWRLDSRQSVQTGCGTHSASWGSCLGGKAARSWSWCWRLFRTYYKNAWNCISIFTSAYIFMVWWVWKFHVSGSLPNLAVEWMALLLRIRGSQVHISIRRPFIVSGYFRNFLSLSWDTGVAPQICLWPLPSTSFTILYPQIHLSFDGMNIVTCRPIAKERLGKHIPAATNTQATIR